MKNRIITTERKAPEYYKGMLVQADPGVHATAASLFKKFVPTGSSVLDIGAGTGAFCQRLADHGYQPTGLDVEASQWKPQQIHCIRHDLNRSLSDNVGRGFDAACCLEVIEHIENPWSLMREISNIVRPGGWLILSTPNITSFLSRMLFVISGKFATFGEANLEYGHINPMSAFEIHTVSTRTGWEVVEKRAGGYLPILDLTAMSPRGLVMNALRAAFYLISRGDKEGWCLLFAMRRRHSE